LAGKQVVVLGGGVGGLVASNLVKKGTGGKAEVTLIERKKTFQFPPSYPWLMLGMRKPEQTERSLSALGHKGIEVVNDEILSINLGENIVRTRNSSFPFDYLIIALGAEYAPESIPGFKEHAHHIYDLESAIRFRDAIEHFSGDTIAMGVSRTPFKCPAAPYEAVLLVEHLLRAKGLRDKVKMTFFTPEGLPLPSAGPDIGKGVAEMLKSRGIDARYKVKLTGVKANEAIFEDGSTIPFDLFFAVPPHKCPQPVVESGLTDQTGWIPVAPATMRTRNEDIFAVGDVTSVATPSGYVPFLPKAGVFAHRQAEVVSHNISVEITGKGAARAYDGSGECFLMTGGSQAGFVKGTWFTAPHPDIKFSSPSRSRYAERVLFEKYWMSHWF
jgi:sulfide:quinone oxidoreductase